MDHTGPVPPALYTAISPAPTESTGYGSPIKNEDGSVQEPPKKKQKRNKPTLSCFECVERKTKVSLLLFNNSEKRAFEKIELRSVLPRFECLGTSVYKKPKRLVRIKSNLSISTFVLHIAVDLQLRDVQCISETTFSQVLCQVQIPDQQVT
jgi:hypothetical protein